MNSPRETFTTGSQRDSREGKGRYDLLPPDAIRAIAIHFEKGAKKYEARNWEKGQPLSRLIDSGLRHAFSALEGLEDEDHLAAAAWNFMCAISIRERVRSGKLPKKLDDVPKEIHEVTMQDLYKIVCPEAFSAVDCNKL